MVEDDLSCGEKAEASEADDLGSFANASADHMAGYGNAIEEYQYFARGESHSIFTEHYRKSRAAER